MIPDFSRTQQYYLRYDFSRTQQNYLRHDFSVNIGNPYRAYIGKRLVHATFSAPPFTPSPLYLDKPQVVAINHLFREVGVSQRHDVGTLVECPTAGP